MKGWCSMDNLLNLMLESILFFFFENNNLQGVLKKSEEKVRTKAWDKIKEKIKLIKLQRKINAYAKNYFRHNFDQLPLSEEFDFQELTKYLNNNIETDILPCLTKPNQEERIHCKESLLGKACFYAKAKNNLEKENIVKAYVKVILDIFERDFLDKVDEKYLILASRIVDETTTHIDEKAKESVSDLKNSINYHGSFAKDVDSVAAPKNNEKQYHYLNKNIKFFGRSEEFKYLDAFLEAPEPLLFTVITADGGAGKSKLMYHYMQSRIGDIDWKIVFPEREHIIKWQAKFTEYRYPENLLIIIDYAGEIAEIFGKWMAFLDGSTHDVRPPKLRFVLLERQKPSNDPTLNPHWYEKLTENREAIKKYLYKQKFYQLHPLDKSSLLLLTANIAENKGKTLKEDEKELIYKRALKLNHGDDNKQYVTPLLVILITDVYVNNKNIKSFDTSRLMKDIIEKDVREWKQICENDNNLYKNFEQLLVYATATGGWNLKQLKEPLEETSKNLLQKFNKKEFKQHFSNF